MTHDPLARLRLAALDGLAPLTPVSFARKARPRRGVTHPDIPVGAMPPAQEPLPIVLVREAATWWRRCAPSWAPPLEAMIRRGPVTVRRMGDELRVETGVATYRVRGAPEAWMAVMVAALTGRELVPTRRALRAGVVAFARSVAA